MLFWGKKKEEPYPQEEIPKLPTVEEIMRELPKISEHNIPKEPPRAQESTKESQSSPTPVNIPVVRKPEVKPVFHKEKEEEKKQKEPEGVMAAPLFVKLDKYKQLLSNLIQVKSSIAILKNNLIVFNELDKLRNENMKLVQENLEKVEKKIADLDAALLKPSGFREEFIPQMEEVASIEATIADLKSQMAQLRGELETTS